MEFYFIFFLLLFLYFRRYKSPVLNGVLLFYVLASISAIVTHYVISPDRYITFFSLSFHLLTLFFFIHPVIEYGKHEKQRRFVLMDDKRFILLSYALIGLQLYSIAFFIKDDFIMLTRGDFNQIRSEILQAGRGTGSIFRTIAGVASFYYCYNILLFFYSLAFRHDSKLFLVLLGISSSSRIFHSLSYIGRDGILFWLFSFVFSYLIFKPYLTEKSRSISKKVMVAIGSFAVVVFGLISLSRFGSDDSGTLNSLFSYFGQPLNNFGQLFERFHDYKGTESLFPLLYGEKGATGGDVIGSADNFIAKYGIASNAFYSFIGSFYLAWGPFLTLFIAIIYDVVMTNKLRTSTTTMPVLILLMIIIQIVIHNYFYWAYYIGVANLFLFTTPIFLIFCKKRNSLFKIKENRKQIV